MKIQRKNKVKRNPGQHILRGGKEKDIRIEVKFLSVYTFVLPSILVI